MMTRLSQRAPRVTRLLMVFTVLLSMMMIIAPRPTAAAAPPPAPSVSVVPHGTFAFMTVTNPAPAQIDVWVFASESGTINNCVPNFPRIDFAIGAGNVTNWTFKISSLQPRTRYEYVVRATVNGASSCYIGQFNTLSPKVTVDFQKIKVNNDSDIWGAGELTFYFKVYDKWEQGLTTNEMSISSGQTVTINKIKSYVNEPDFITLAVQGQDEDCVFCSYGIGPKAADSGSTSQQDWNTAYSGEISLRSPGPNENFSQTVFFSSSWWPVGFTVKAIITVKYV